MAQKSNEIYHIRFVHICALKMRNNELPAENHNKGAYLNWTTARYKQEMSVKFNL